MVSQQGLSGLLGNLLQRSILTLIGLHNSPVTEALYFLPNDAALMTCRTRQQIKELQPYLPC